MNHFELSIVDELLIDLSLEWTYTSNNNEIMAVQSFLDKLWKVKVWLNRYIFISHDNDDGPKTVRGFAKKEHIHVLRFMKWTLIRDQKVDNVHH